MEPFAADKRRFVSQLRQGGQRDGEPKGWPATGWRVSVVGFPSVSHWVPPQVPEQPWRGHLLGSGAHAVVEVLSLLPSTWVTRWLAR